MKILTGTCVCVATLLISACNLSRQTALPVAGQPSPSKKLDSLTAAATDSGAPENPPEEMWLPDLSVGKKQNGIHPREAADFWNKWRLVTTRFRPDNNELRFVYANSLAWNALEKKQQTFPTGAMFAKIGFSAKHDPAFPVSMIPQGFQRVQLMKKMKTGYENSNNWSYALYVGDPAKDTMFGMAELQACHACHALVPERDYVFSKPTFLSENITALSPLKSRFTVQSTKDLDPSLVNVISATGPRPDKIRTYKMLLFFGSLSESVGPLAGFAKQDYLPYLLIGTSVENRFLLATPKAADSTCSEPGANVFSSLGIGSLKEPKTDPRDYIEVRRGRECKGAITWEQDPLIVSVKK